MNTIRAVETYTGLELSEYENAPNSTLLDSFALSLQNTKEYLQEIIPYYVDYFDEIEGAESIQELAEIIYEEGLGQADNTYNYNWWGGVREYLIVYNYID